ncbi:MAG: hypothetical protein AAF824_18130 [Bacteroidota bacterium]
MKLDSGYAYIRHLSLDVMAGSLCSGLMVATLLEVQMPWVWWVSLPVGVWLIYTADHLLDARRLGESAHTPRHRFHYRYASQIGIAWAVVFLLCIGIIPWYSPRELLLAGLAMGMLVGIHLVLVKWIGSRVSILFQKELGVGIIYGLGVWIGPLALDHQLPTPSTLFMFLQFTLLAFLNLIIFSHYDRQVDELDGHSSLVRAMTDKGVTSLVLTCTSLFLILGCLVLREGLLPVQGIYMAMLLILLATYFFPTYFGQEERFRSWGDGVFLLPIISLL